MLGPEVGLAPKKAAHALGGRALLLAAVAGGPGLPSAAVAGGPALPSAAPLPNKLAHMPFCDTCGLCKPPSLTLWQLGFKF